MALAQQQTLDRRRAWPGGAGRSELPPGLVLHGHVEQRENGGDGWRNVVTKRQQPGGETLAAGSRPVVALVELEVVAQEVDQREIGGGLAVRDRAGGEDLPAVERLRVRELPVEARLPDAGLADHADDLTAASRRLARGRCRGVCSSVCRPTSGLRPASGGGLQAAANGPGADELERLSTGSASPLTCVGPRAMKSTKPSTSRSVSAVSRIVPGAANCSMRAARWVVWPTAV